MIMHHCQLGLTVSTVFVMLALLGNYANSTESTRVSSDGVWERIDVEGSPALRHDSAEAAIEQVQDAGSERHPAAEQSEVVNTFRLNKNALATTMVGTPSEQAGFSLALRSNAAQLDLPMPDGRFMAFRYLESPIMAPELAAKFPDIKTYVGQSIDDPAISVRFDNTPAGFHAQVLSDAGAWYVEPENGEKTAAYVSYQGGEYRSDDSLAACLTRGQRPPGRLAASSVLGANSAIRTGDILRQYRLAVATTGEYGRFHGGTVAGALSGVVTTINRVNGIFEKELAVRLVLVANNDSIIYTDPFSDPFLGNDNANILIDESQRVIDSRIGSSNYDIGHTFSTGGGGLAYIGTICDTDFKAQGVSGHWSPRGDRFDVNIVAHEIGHQFGADHSFNGIRGYCGASRSPASAFEPGSGSTIMSYAGICDGDNLQNDSHAVFHSGSYAEILGYLTSGWASCYTPISLVNTIPSADAGPDRHIPSRTPFVLSGIADDPDQGNALSYSWEELDLGPPATLDAVDDGRIPLFRAHLPSSSPNRFFPKLSDVVAARNDRTEKIPRLSRRMNFRFTVRDGVGGVAADDRAIVVDSSAGPFRVLTPNGGETLHGNINVTWDPASTNAGAIDTQYVDIFLSTDGGSTFDLDSPIVSGTPNDGSEIIPIGSDNLSQDARLMVKGANNVFYDISDQNFTVTVSPANLVAPNGLIDGVVPTFFWKPARLSTWYYLWIDDANGNSKFKKWFTAAETGCPNNVGDCSITPSLTLPFGNYTWWIQTYAASVNGLWSNGMDFSVPDLRPSAVTLVSPADTLGDTTPRYTWNAVVDASYYYLWVNDVSGNRIKQWYTADEVGCGGGSGICSVEPTIEVKGESQWWIQTWNSFGHGPWSSAKAFQVAGLAPAIVSLRTPNNDIANDTTPSYVWEAVVGATYYYLWVDDSTGNRVKHWYSAGESGCVDGTGTCSVTPAIEVKGDSEWWVQSWNFFGFGPWSAGQVFSVTGSPPGAVTLLSPAGSGVATLPTYRWNAVPWSTWYQLWVTDSSGVRIRQWYSVTDAGCGGGGGVCSVIADTTVKGAGEWWVRPWNTFGEGEWSQGMTYVTD